MTTQKTKCVCGRQKIEMSTFCLLCSKDLLEVTINGVTYVKKEAKAEVKKARDFFIYPDESHNESAFTATVYDTWAGIGKLYHAREVVDGEIFITREQATSIWNNALKLSFNDYLKYLGFKE